MITGNATLVATQPLPGAKISWISKLIFFYILSQGTWDGLSEEKFAKIR